MRYLLIIFSSFLFAITSCNKKEQCNTVTITQSGTPCSLWGIKVNNQVYPSNTIPIDFQKEGLVVCAGYTLFEDLRMCACCRGTWADITFISLPKD
ncbi:MAG: hypothetical protein WBC06_17485 [Chitinophagaceae bacterium]